MIYGGVLLVIVNTPPMAYTLIYLIECFSQRLPWKWCPGGVGGIHAVSAENYVSNVSCYEITQYQYPCVRVNSTLARRYGSGNYTGPEAVAVQEVTGGPAVVVPLTEYTALRNACIPGNISSQEYYWWKEVLNLTSSIAEPGAIQPRVAISLAVCWFLGFLTIRTGPRSLAKVSAVSVYAKFALLLALCFVAVRLSGALRGVATCLKPDLKKLPKAKTWYSATRLLFYSTGLSLGSTTCFASYNNFQADILMHSVKVSVADFVYSLLGMVFVFSLYGHVAQSYTVPISDVITPGAYLVE
ncbi:sodium- and chloride-dependent transporter XTRP3-like [Haemaphysalis longicornis]